MASDKSASPRLDDLKRALIRDCLGGAGLLLPPDRFERLIRDVEASIAHYPAGASEDSFRVAHDALRELWHLSHDDDPPVGQIRARIAALPPQAIEYIDRRVPIVVSRLFRNEPSVTRFVEWAVNADPWRLIQATQVLTAEGAQVVEGRSRGAGKRSERRLEPVIMGEVRGAGAQCQRGGRPENAHRQDLVMHLAIDWLRATDELPKPGRSDETGFGDLVHKVFQWLDLPDGSAGYALRRYWSEVRRVKAREPLEDFLRATAKNPDPLGWRRVFASNSLTSAPSSVAGCCDAPRFDDGDHGSFVQPRRLYDR
jgi:hypothetical protein